MNRYFKFPGLILSGLVACCLGIAAPGQASENLLNQVITNYDARAFYLLASRAGRKINASKAEATVTYLKNHPENMTSVLNRWDILYDSESELARKQAEWERKYGLRAYVLNSRYYLILATEKDRDYAAIVGFYLDRMTDSYATVLGRAVDEIDRYALYLYPDEASFRSSGGPARAVAYFFANRRELVGCAQSTKGTSNNIQRILRNFFHEGGHHATLYRMPRPYIWLDEGLAMQFESTGVSGSRLTGVGTSINSSRLKRAAMNVRGNRTVEIETMMTSSRRQFNQRALDNYAQAWSLVYFFRHGSRHYQRNFENLMANLKDGIDYDEAFRRAFIGVDWENLEDSWKKYVRTLRPRSTSVKIADIEKMRQSLLSYDQPRLTSADHD
ncbi:MAG: DUF1570 domain-containing protein [Planctomycetes bacterium]|nr:DUF1570 domain-containing protein [Planctomycetota bacterium]